MDIVVLDFGGEVDTIAFNSQDRTALLGEIEPQSIEALELARKGLRRKDLKLIGQAATISSLANQAILYKPQLDRVLNFAERAGAVGVNVGHSGTVIGVLLDRSLQSTEEVARFLNSELPDLKSLTIHHLISGGCQSPLPLGEG
jgi:L-threonine kinase